jgi:pimeloyl-ACP methyl ester carboxylesterase
MSKKTIIILHGWRLDGKTFNPLKKILEKKGFRVFAPDLPGFGKNNMIDKPLVLQDYVDFLDKYIQKKRLSDIRLICHSFGGRVGIKYCAFKPEKINYLILSGVPGYVPVKRWKILFFLLLSKIGKVIFKLPVMKLFEDKARLLLYKTAKASDYMKVKGNLRDTFKNVIKEDLHEDMKRIKLKTILVWGENDKTVPLWIANKIQKTIKKSQLVIVPDTNHRLPFMNSDIFYKKIVQIL